MGGKTQEFEFEASPERLWSSVIQCVGTSGYTIIMSDAQSHVVSFNTGRSMKSWAGQDLTATVTPTKDGARLVMGGSLGRGGNPLGGGSQLGAWGEKNALIGKFFEAVRRTLPDVPEPTSSTSPQGDLASELAKLAELRAAGSLSEDEFQTAKARLLG